MNLPPLVHSADEVLININSFQSEVEKHGRENALVSNLSHFRSWFAVTNGDVKIYGPSKWIAYLGLTCDQYGAINNHLDGRKTEAVLRNWFAEVPEGPEHDVLMSGLHAYLAKFGKKPSTLSRVSLLRDKAQADDPTGVAFNRLADALLTLYRNLPKNAQNEFRRLLKKEI